MSKTNLEISDSIISSNFTLNNSSSKTSSISKVSSNVSGCIDNIDFEFGDFTNWKCYKGTAKTNGTNYVTWSPTTPVAPIANRHQLISSTSLPVNDVYGGFPRLCPSGGNYSLQLGNNSTGSQAEKVSCTFTIPADQNDFQIEYYYAVVFQDPNHNFDQQPRFQAKVYDANNSSNVISCASYDFTAGSGLPGFQSSTLDPLVLFKPWTAVTINLSGYAGHTVILEFTTEDCTRGQHFGYAYVDVNSNCISLVNSTTYCENIPSLTLKAPSGYQTYNWYDGTFTNLLGTGETLTLSPPPATSTTINVDLVPYVGFGCRDTAFTVLNVNPAPIAAFQSDTTICIGKPVNLTNISSIRDNSVLTYFWNFGDNTTSTSTNNVKLFNSVGNYKVKLIATSVNGCIDSIVRNISVVPLPVISPITGNKNICKGQSELLQNSTPGGTWKSMKPSIATISNGGLLTAISPGNDTIKYIVSNSNGCTDSVFYVVKIIATSSSTTTASVCRGSSYLFNGTSYKIPGTYPRHLINSAGCDSVATLVLTEKLQSSSIISDAICSGGSYYFNGVNYTASGTYMNHFTNAVGCDSIAILILNVINSTVSTTNAAICQGSSYLFNGTSYNAAGTYTSHLINEEGCDSIATLNLNIKLPTVSTTNAGICQGSTYLFNGTSYNAAGTYTTHLINAAGCDSTAILNLSIKLHTTSTTYAAICQGSSYLFNSISYNDAGSYTTHLINAVGCDSTAILNLSIKLHTTSTTNAAICQGSSYLFNGISYNAAGTYTANLTNAAGCDSTATLNLAIKLPTTSITNAAICQGSSYVFNGTSYSAAGTYIAHLINAAGCDSTATLNLKIKLPTVSTTNAGICQGSTYLFNGTSYNAAGTYTAHLINAAGCDSTAILNLSIKLHSISTTIAAICQGSSYLFNGISYNAAGSYTTHLINAAGCDSTAILNLSIKLHTTSITNAAICQGGSYLFNTLSYNTAGTYTVHLLNAAGCDSSAILNLTIKLPTTSTTDTAICQGSSYLFNGTTYSTPGTYTANLTNAAGCDSTATLNLSIKLPTTSTTNAAICQGSSYLFNGTSYNAAGAYAALLVNAAGCDSIATLNLSIKLSTSSTINAAICQGSSYLFNGISYNAAGTYTAHLINAAGCDSTAILNLSIKLHTTSTTYAAICQGSSYLFNSISYNAAGSYTTHLINAAGCDSTATLNISIKLPTTSTTNEAICQGSSYLFNGTSYNAAGTYTALLVNAAGCDSIATLNLSIKLPTSSTTIASICQGSSYLFNGTSYNAAGTYTAHLLNAAGCDSTATLNLSMKLPTTSTTNAAICQGSSYVFNGTTYSAAGIYTANLTNAAGCDSIATLNLSMKLPTTSTTNAAICQGSSYVFNGTTYSAAGIYTANLTNAAGCDSVATLNLSIKLPTTSTTNAAICQGSSYLFNGISYNAAGTYTANLTNAAGCDSIATLNLSMKLHTTSTTNASICQGNSYLFNGISYNTAGTYTAFLVNAAGCDSTATLNLSMKLPTTSTTIASICQGDSYLFNTISYNTAGTYTAHLVNAAGCDSIATLNLTIKLPTSSTTNDAICQGSSYVFNGTTYSTAGIYTANLTNAAGCDSIATLNLTIKLPTSSTTNEAICQGSSYVFNGTTYSTAGIYTANLTNAAGCDSIATLNLSIKLPTTSTTNAAICQGSSYVFNGTTYSAAGIYTANLTNAAGCDSVATLNLSIKLPTTSTTNAAICQGSSYLFNGISYNAAGTYTAHLVNAAGCDSIATLNLTIKLPTSSTTNEAICQGRSYLFNGTSYNTAGTYTALLVNAAGCDSTAILNLSIKLPTTSVTNAAICQGSSYLFNGISYNTAGTYTALLVNAAGCDSTATLNISIKLPTSSTTNEAICQGRSYLFNGTTYNAAGTYTALLVNAAGCDSIATLNLTIKLPTYSTTNEAICQGSSYVFNGTTYSTAGTYTANLTNAAGCDSTATLNLSMKLPTASITNVAICQGDSYLFNTISYNTAGTYTAHLVNAAGCDSIATLNLSIKLPTTSTTIASICQGSSYLFNGTSYNAAGTYTAHLLNAAGCDSIATLNLTIKLPTSSTTNDAICQGSSYLFNGTSYSAAGTYTAHLINAAGCDSTATLNLSMKLPTTSTTNVSICQGSSYLFNGISYNTAGTYTALLVNAAGCDSTATLNLSIKLPITSITNAAICQGSSYLFNGISYNTAGTYTALLVNAAGCDSTATLNLSIKLPATSVTNAGICQGSSYLFNGTSYSAAGTYTAHLINAAGCDSTATLNLSIKLPTTSTTNEAICQGSSYVFSGTTYSTAGIYTANLTNAAGCDSIATLNLTIKLPASSTTNEAICQGRSYLFNGTTYNAAGTYTALLVNAAGCDSIATLNLTIKLPTSSTTNEAICQGSSYVFNGTSYNAAGTYTANLVNAAGCDSTATLNLSIKLSTTSITNAAICQGSSYLFNGISYNTAGTYTALLVNAAGCDSTATLNLSIKLPTTSVTNSAICQGSSYLFNNISYNAAGTYTVLLVNAAGCDSIATLNLSIKLPTTSTTNAAICQGGSYVFNGTTYSAVGIYIANLTNTAGCDSIATLNLSMKLPTTSITNATICQGSSYLFNGISYNAAGTYTANLTNAAGCDSIATLNLSMKLPTTSTTYASICQGSSYLFNGVSYNSAGTYTALLVNTAGCDSTATLNLIIKLPTTSVTNAAICQGSSYLFNGISYNTAGTYTALLVNAAGCDSTAILNLSMKLPTTSTTIASICQGSTYLFNGISYNDAGTYIALLVNAAGCDSTATLNLSIKLPTSSTTNAAICQDSSYLFNGTSYNAAGTYTALLVNAAGCDSTAILNLSIKLPTTSVTNAAICQGSSYLFNGISYNTAGTYTANLVNAAGCDSTATLNLNIKLPTTSTTNDAICQGSSYLFNGISYNAAGTYTVLLVNAAGCDSIATLNLSIKLPTTSTTNAAICQGSSYVFNGTTYSAVGIYTGNLTNTAGCDSIATLNLSMKLPTTSTTNAAICQGSSYIFNGTSYSTAGTYTANLTNAAGCDSTATLNLSIKLPTTSTTNASICQGSSYLFNGTSYNAAGTYTALLVNAAGCDSTAMLNLSIKLPTTSITNAAICQGSSYVFNGTSYNAAGTYTALLVNAAGCDSTAMLNLSIKLPTTSITNAAICQGSSYVFNGTSYNAAGTYTALLVNAAGCDSTATLNLSMNLPTASTTNVAICQGSSYLFNGTSYNAAGTFTTNLTNAVGCDSIATLNLSMKLPTTSTTNAAICQGSSYIFNGTTYSTAGTYTANLTNAAGCDSIATLNLRIKLPTISTTNAAICQGSSYVFNGTTYLTAGTYTANLMNVAGCDSTATLNLSIKLPTTSTTIASICQGSSYLFNGTSYNAAGTYTAHLLNVAGCDSIATLNLTIKLPTSSTTNDAICQGSSYVFNGTTYSTAGIYTANLTNAAGCDSIATLNLTIKLPTSSTTNGAICQGRSYLFNGTSYNTAGTYTALLVNAAGCDSIATLNLSIKLSTTSTTNAAICQGSSYVFNGTTYSAVGIYTANLTNAAGCDSVATLNLSIKLPTTSTTNAAICQGSSYLFNSISYNAAGTYTAHLVNAAGCDSTATLNLSIKLPTTSITNAAICQGSSYLFNGTSYNAAGTYMALLVNAAGCDSTATLNLSIKLPTTSTTNAAICQGSSYVFNGTTYSAAGTYTANLTNAAGCDSIATLKLTIKLPTTSTTNAAICQGSSYVFNGTSYNAAGTYTTNLNNAAGCDSIATLNLSMKLPTTSTTNAAICQGSSYLFNGVSYNSAGTYTVHLVNSAGCDSTATLNLSMKLPTSSSSKKTICSQDLPFVWNGIIFKAPGIQSATLINAVGCDSIASLNLTVNSAVSSSLTVTTCPYALPYIWNKISYNAAGTYTIKLSNTKGCDSIATLNLIVKSPLTSTASEFICTSQLPYYWNKKLYYKSGTYTAQFTNPSGCDSITTLILTVVSPTTSTTREAINSNELPYVWNKMAFTESGTYTSPVHYVNSMGCDSIAKLILKVNLSTSAVTNTSICASELPYIWNGSPYYSKGTYTKTMTNVFGDNVIVTLNLTVIAASNVSQSVLLFEGEKYTLNGNVYDKEGIYTDILKTVNGCDSTVITDLSFIKIPNTLTPNGDGHNDVFMRGAHVKIYNRNGILLFEGLDGWDGKYHGNPVSQDTYFYVLYYISEGKTKSKEGYIMIIR